MEMNQLPLKPVPKPACEKMKLKENEKNPDGEIKVETHPLEFSDVMRFFKLLTG